MQQSRSAHVEVGIQSYDYKASLDIFHPTLSPAEISELLGMEADRSHAKGDSRTTPKGTPLEGVYPSAFWIKDLEAEDGVPLPDCVRDKLEFLEQRREGFSKICCDGGEVSFRLHVVSQSIECGDRFPSDSLLRLGNLGIGLVVDVFFRGSTTPSSTSSGSDRPSKKN